MSHARHDILKLNPTEPIVTVDQESAIVAANPAACRALGASEESLRGAPFLGRVDAEARPSASAMLMEGLRGRPGEAALTLRCGRSEDRPFMVRVVPVMRESDSPRLLLVLREP